MCYQIIGKEQSKFKTLKDKAKGKGRQREKERDKERERVRKQKREGERVQMEKVVESRGRVNEYEYIILKKINLHFFLCTFLQI